MSFSFGTPTPSAGLGGAAAPVGSFSFGAPKPATTMPPPAFGATSSLGAAAATVAAPSFGFNSTAVSAAPTLSFGGPQAATVAPTASTLPAFGAPATNATLPTFGTAPAATATVAPTFSFGTPAANAPTTAPPAFGFGATPTTAATSMPGMLGQGVGAFAFNKPLGGLQPTTAASLNFNTITTTATAQPFNTGLRMGTGLAPAAGVGGIFGKPLGSGIPPTTAPPTFIGLGGIDVTATQPKLGDSKQDGVKIKETQVPDEIVKTVDALKSYIKHQKTISSDIGRTSTSKFSNVSHDIMNLKWVLQSMSNAVDTNNQQIKLLRSETAKTIQSLEMAQRTQDTPAGLQFENSAPFQYFQCLVAKYEQDLISFRQQITLTERHMHALANPQNVSPEDLKRGFLQLNESFISLAGRLHELHQRVEEQKDHYLNLRRFRLGDTTNVFEKIDNPPEKLVEPQRISIGPTPFSNISAISTLNKNYGVTAAASSTSAPAAK